MQIENNKDCFVELWRQLEFTRDALRERHKRFTIRRVLKEWMPAQATDHFICQVCWTCDQLGLNELPQPRGNPRPCREFLSALVQVYLGISRNKVRLRDLDKAYSVAFPKSTPINSSKKVKSNN